jgi:hypothetical protein
MRALVHQRPVRAPGIPRNLAGELTQVVSGRGLTVMRVPASRDRGDDGQQSGGA